MKHKSKYLISSVINVNDLDGEESIILIDNPRHIIRRANKAEIEILKESLKHSFHTIHDIQRLYERSVEEDPNKKGTFPFYPLPEEEWRYFVIEYSETNLILEDVLKNALILLEKEIYIENCLEIEAGELKSWGYPSRNNHFGTVIPTSSKRLFRTFSKSLGDKIKEDCRLIMKHDNQIVDFEKRMQQFQELYRIPSDSPLRFLGYFSIIESLLAHKPEPTDRFDSLTRQIKSKFRLLNNRFSVSIDYPQYFGETSPDKIWQKLYGLRSCIAHGEPLNFHREFKALKNYETSVWFVHVSTKKLLYHCLHEPELVRDIK